MASEGFGTAALAVASPAGNCLGRRASRPSSAHVPAATKIITAKAEVEKGLFDLIFGPMFKEEQLLEMDPILNKVKGKAAPTPRKAGTVAKKAAAGSDESGNGGLFTKKG